jgi:endoglycosylceramidase
VAFGAFSAKAKEWNVPLFVGEFGISAAAGGASGYIAMVQDHIEQLGASAAQWAYSPGWDPVKKDGWDSENLSVIDDHGATRDNFHLRAYPRAIAGVPKAFKQDDGHIEFAWDHVSKSGATEIFVPAAPLFGDDGAVQVDAKGATCKFDGPRTIMRCESPNDGAIRVVVQRSSN